MHERVAGDLQTQEGLPGSGFEFKHASMCRMDRIPKERILRALEVVCSDAFVGLRRGSFSTSAATGRLG